MYFLRNVIFLLILNHFDWLTAKNLKLTSDFIGYSISKKNDVKFQDDYDEMTPAVDTTTTKTFAIEDITTSIISTIPAINDNATKIDINSDQAKQIAKQVLEEYDIFVGQEAGEVKSIEYITILHQNYDLKMVICHKRPAEDDQTTTVSPTTNEPITETATSTSTTDLNTDAITKSAPVTEPNTFKTTEKNEDICGDLNCDDLDLDFDFDFDFSIKNRVRKAALMSTFCEDCRISANHNYEILQHQCKAVATFPIETTTTESSIY